MLSRWSEWLDFRVNDSYNCRMRGHQRTENWGKWFKGYIKWGASSWWYLVSKLPQVTIGPNDYRDDALHFSKTLPNIHLKIYGPKDGGYFSKILWTIKILMSKSNFTIKQGIMIFYSDLGEWVRSKYYRLHNSVRLVISGLCLPDMTIITVRERESVHPKPTNMKMSK